ncbi:MAG: serine hydrolase [Bacteroidia bacterium]|nr:serine hydrolase [Bacteroidia bacterium]
MKILKRIVQYFVLPLALLCLGLWVTGHGYLFKGVWNTYLKGRTGPSATEHGIFENRKVYAGQGIGWPHAAEYNSRTIPPAFLKDFENMETGSYIIVRNDSLIHEQYWDGFSDTSHSNSFSVAKTFVSILVGCAIRDGSIQSVDQRVGDFLEEFKNSPLTIRHLLTMSSGIGFDEDYKNPFSYPARAYYGSNLRELTLSYKQDETPGKIFRYLSGNTMLLSFVLKKATGQTISEYFSSQLWSPLGAKESAWWSLDHADGDEKAYCCFHSNASDFARIGQLYLDSGRFRGEQIVPADFVSESVRPAPLVDADGKPNEKYGFSWWILPDHKGHYIYYARGILGQYIICIPDERMVVVRLGEKREKRAGDEHPADLLWYINCALELYGKRVP